MRKLAEPPIASPSISGVSVFETAVYSTRLVGRISKFIALVRDSSSAAGNLSPLTVAELQSLGVPLKEMKRPSPWSLSKTTPGIR